MRRLVVLLAAAGIGSGCVGSMLESGQDAPEVYRLEGPAAQAPGAGLPLALGVARPRAAASLDTERIAVVRPGAGFGYYAGMRWADPAPQMLQSLLVQSIGSAGRFATVVASPSRVPADLLLDVELRRFEAVYANEAGAPRVRVELEVSVVDNRKGVRIASFNSASESAAGDNRQQAVIAAFELATSDAVQAVARQVFESASGAPR